ncbi:carbamoyl-phosphate synthase small chain [Philodulcilactobacillus myokoensis]|uniref:Carbamoyl phosphate synthase small chain n=1 Tax=Philodulcilactobacillus myokoensis TaxID=2929573 RepID=A0A9W6ESK1_9LACO|nr:carbamoyl phosphate synthase small subunit [Philodulcilactobacillus myokoensis]GLB46865.1 carbamoyl-phosphate synthase small chain [Philodulcilactobacillus myokoensis]
MATRYLILEDGTAYQGKAFGSRATTTGKIIVNSNMLGYQEIITNPIYHDQIIVFTQPSIGNIGINHKSYESISTSIKGVVTHEYSDISTNRLSKLSLDDFLKQRNIPGISGIDTRELAHHLRKHGAMKASLVDVADQHAFDQLNATVLTNQQVSQVATPKPYPNPGTGLNIIVIDFGLKHGILKQLSERHCDTIVLPWNVDSKNILDLDPDGIILSTGPGSPYDLPKSVLKMIQNVQKRVPLFAMGLGHELFALANHASLYQLKIDYHNSSHPIKEIITNHVLYASQNQEYSVDNQSIQNSNLIVTYRDLVNRTIQGLRHRDYPAFSVQFSPDGGPGPTDSVDLYDEFLENISSNMNKRSSRNDEF